MSRSSRHKGKSEKNSEISKDYNHDGTAARTRPLSLDEIMTKRKNKKKLFENKQLGVVDGNTEKSDDQSRRGDSRSKDSSHGVKKHMHDEDAKTHSNKKEENTLMKDYYSKRKDREAVYPEIKLKSKVEKDLKDKGKSDEKSSKRKEENTSMKDDYSKRKDRELGDSEIKLRSKVEKDMKDKGKSDEKSSKSKEENTFMKDDYSKRKDRELGDSEIKLKSRVEKDMKDKDKTDEKISKRQEENTPMKDGYSKRKDRELADSEIKLKSKVEKDLKDKGKTDEKTYARRKRDEVWSKHVENETLRIHSRDLKEKDRHTMYTMGKFERENKRKYQSEVDEKNRDRYGTREHDMEKVHDSETSERNYKKEIPKSHHEELNSKRKRSRSREHVDRKKRSTSPTQRSQRRSSYYDRDDEEPKLSLKERRSEWSHSDTSKTKTLNNESNGHYKRHGSSASGLGGYSPRKRRTEAGAKTPSPTKQSPEKKSAKWDLVPAGADNTSAPIPPNFQLSNQLTFSNIHEAAIVVPVASTVFKPLPGVPFGFFSTNKHDSIDSIQLTQATRPMRRLYVENIPASASEKDVVECFNIFLISSGANRIPGAQPCISCIIHKEKSQALVEFLTPEDASAALSFDGRSFSGSIIKIRRPKEFVEVATGEPEKSVAHADAISSIVNDTPYKIFIGGISKALSSEMIMEIASTFGTLKAYHFEYSDDHREPRAFLEYADQAVTSKACASLNGMKLGGQVVTAVQAFPNTPILASSGNTPFYGIPEHAKALLKKPTEVIKLKNVFDPDTLPSLSHVELEDVLEDVRLECTRFGTVKSVNVINAAPVSASVACVVNDAVYAAGSPEKLVCNEANDEIEMIKETADYKSMEGNGVDNDNSGGSVMEDETHQPGKMDDGSTIVDNRSPNIIPDSQELVQNSKDGSECIVDNATDNVERKDVSLEGQTHNKKELDLEDANGKSEEPLIDDRDHRIESDASESRESKEQNSDTAHIFEPGCVFVEFRRTEASCMAAHCLHGRLFDNQTVTVEYVPLDLYRTRFPK